MPESTGARGRLAQMIATRGGLAPPEDPFVIEHREALFYMLCEASELEHGIMCQYLYAAFSLKQSADEGLTAAEAEAVQRWRKHIFHIAAQEMLHLALVQNLLTATGAAPHLSRPNFPQPASHYPAGVHLALVPFGEEALRHFMFLERPEGMDLEDAAGMAAFAKRRARGRAPRAGRRDRPARPGLRHRRAPVPVHRGRDRAPGREARRGGAVHRAVAGAGHPAVLRLAGTDRGHRRGLGAAGHRRDPGAGRGPARGLEGGALRPVRRDPRRVPAAARGQPGLRPGPARGHGQRQAVRARHQRSAGHRPDHPPGHGPVQRQLRDPAADAAALLRAHRGDRSPAQGAGRREPST